MSSDSTTPSAAGKTIDKESERNEEEEIEAPPPGKNSRTPKGLKRKIYNGMIEFDVAQIKDQVVCSLCDGLYREPYTTIKCFHTFCKSCLAAALYSSWNTKNYNCCPRCELYFGRLEELSSIALPDRTLETLIDKVLFPGLAAADENVEFEFYRRRGISRKDGSAEQNLTEEQLSPSRSTSTSDLVTFCLIPEHVAEEENNGCPTDGAAASQQSAALPPLHLPFLETRGSIRIGQLKKYLKNKLNLVLSEREIDDASDDTLDDEDSELEIICNSVPLGNELSVTFVSRTVWMDPAKKLILEYRRANNDGRSLLPRSGSTPR